jgi:hypothetical protein
MIMIDGVRIYGTWGGNPKGTREDVTRCIESVLGNERGAIAHQCDRKRGHGEGGLYCKQHDPKAAQARREESSRKYQEMLDKRFPNKERVTALEKILAEARSVADALDGSDNATLAGLGFGLKALIIKFDKKYPQK